MTQAQTILSMIENVDPADTDTLDEIWKPVFGYEGLYEVSSLGNVKSKGRYRLNGKYHKSRILKTPCNSHGRRIVSLYKDNKKKSLLVHRLVAISFMGVSDKIVCHKNGDRTDDRLDNLYYGTHQENSDDMKVHGTRMYGEKNHNSILTSAQVIEIRKSHKKNCKKFGTLALAKKYYVSPSTISAVISGQNWSTITQGHSNE